MMSELVVVSAWICPPVVLAVVVLVPKVVLPGVLGVVLAGVLAKFTLALPARISLLMAARKVAASLVASAFFNYTTWMLPLGACEPG